MIVRQKWGALMRSGDARKNFPKISINNVITLATRVRITLLKVFSSLHFSTVFDNLYILIAHYFLGYGGGLSKASSKRDGHRDAVSEPPGDSGACREEPQTDHNELRRGHFLASDASPYCRVSPVIHINPVSLFQVGALHYLYIFSFNYLF
jgi:hypothetical protein